MLQNPGKRTLPTGWCTSWISH